MQLDRSLETIRWWLACALVFVSGLASAAYVAAPEVKQECEEKSQRAAKEPGSPEARFENAICMTLLGHAQQSRRVAKSIKKLDVDYKSKALPVYLERYQKNPNDPRTAYRVAFLYYFNENRDEALRYFSIAAEHKPATQINTWAIGYMSAIKSEQQKWKEAETLARQALAQEPEAYALHAALAAALKGQGRYFDAMQEYLTAKKFREQSDEPKKN
jgi:tetratricopeptide (TPR) repeat protein